MCAEELSGYVLATETMGSTPFNSCKNKFNLENSDQFKLSNKTTGSHGFCFLIFFFYIRYFFISNI